MVWTLLDTAVITSPELAVTLPSAYTETELIISPTTEFFKPTWRFFGDVDQVATVPGVGQVRISSQRIPLEKSLIYLDTTYPYELRFTCFYWLGDSVIEIYKNN